MDVLALPLGRIVFYVENLFAFGDVDGKGCDAKLQHPLAVAWNFHSQQLFVADSYNHKIKLIDTTKKTCTSFLGTGKPGSASEQEVHFNEPGGLCVSSDGQQLYVADTNNHVIRVVELDSKKVTQLDVRNFKDVSKKADVTTTDGNSQLVKRLTSSKTQATRRECVHVSSSLPVNIKLKIEFPDGVHLTEGAKSRWQVYFVDETSGKPTLSEAVTFTPQNGFFTEQNMTAESILSWSTGCSNSTFTLQIEAVVYFCEPSGTCRMSGFIYEIPVVRDDHSGNTYINVDHRIAV